MTKIKSIIIFFGDVLLLYGALALTLILRYGPSLFRESFISHSKPFSVIFIVWLMVFYLADLYQIRKLKGKEGLIYSLALAIVISVAVSIALFYLFDTFFQLTPKTNLAIFSFIFLILTYGWRLLMLKVFIASGWRLKILLVGGSPTISEIFSHLQKNPQLGYDIVFWLKENAENKNGQLREIIIKNKIDIIVIPSHFFRTNTSFAKFIYRLLPLKIQVIDCVQFSEDIFQKIPLEELEESWFVERIITRRRFYDVFKRFFDVMVALILMIALSPIMLIIALAIKLSSPGPIIYKQKRMGQDNKIFTLYKFRTMQNENNGPLWTLEKDKRQTSIGKLLRRTHLDEIPQLYNILRGNISFIGPRAERIELAEQYQKIPYYEIRHIIKPGLTGWAQINYRPSASLEEAYEKFKYDLYYIKNRSIFLDLLIVLKTIKYIFLSHQ